MDSGMLLLVERLVVAVETISQDVRNMSAYVYDLSCSVSHVLSEKRGKENITDAACEEGDSPSNVTSAAGQGISAEKEYCGQYERANERSLSNIGDPGHGESSFGDIASMSIDPHEKVDVQSSKSNPIFTQGIKIEEPTDDNELCDVPFMHGHSRNVDNDYTAHMTWMAEEQAETHEMESADDCLVRTRGNLEERPFECSMCRKLFKAGRDLQRHTRVHTGERPYKCQMCGRAFTQSGSLSHHMRSHSGERPYSCNVCLKAFRRRNHLIVHMRTHTDERPYKCNLCGKAFRHSNSLEYHMRTHSREEPN